MSNNSNSQKSHIPKGTIIFGVVLLVLAVVLFFALTGRSTVTGAFPASIKTGSAVCSKDKANYPFVDETDGPKHEGTLRIVATFSESKAVQKIALDYTIYYSDEATATQDKPFIVTRFGKWLTDEKLPHDVFNNKFSLVDKKIVLSLVADLEDVDEKNYKYLLLSKNLGKSLSLVEFRKTFEGKGYKCTTTGE